MKLQYGWVLMERRECHVEIESGRLTLLESVRVLPGKRQVWRAELGGRSVFVKFYFGASAQRHVVRESEGAALLAASPVLSAPLLAQGRLEPQVLPAEVQESINGPIHYLVFGAVEHESSLQDLICAGRRPQELGAALADLVLQLQTAGLAHHDAHLGNILVDRKGALWLLDPDAVRRLEAGPAARVRQAAHFAAQLGFGRQDYVKSFLARYEEVHAGSRAALEADLAQELRRRVQALEKKVLRNCTAVERIQASGGYILLNRAWDSMALRELLRDPEAPWREGRAIILKEGGACNVWSCEVDGRTVVVKRYNHRKGWRGLTGLWRRGRAVHVWAMTHILRDNGVATPSPVACLVRRQGLQRNDYFLSATAGGLRLDAAMQQAVEQGETVRQERLLGAFVRLLAMMKAGSFTHGDCKMMNFFVQQDGRELELIDLDSMAFHKSAQAWSRHARDDVKRFLKNWSTQPQLLELARKLLGC